MAEMKPKRVLGIVGSPRRGGNTERMVDEVLRGAEEAGAQTEKVYLDQLTIGPCRACDACAKSGRCVIRDDMATLMERMAQSQVWVLGTPVYYWGPSAQFKAYLDRWYGTEHEASSEMVDFKEKRIILTIPLGGTAYDARHTVGMFEDAIAYKKSELFATILAPGIEERGAVRERTDVMGRARQAGHDVVATLS